MNQTIEQQRAFNAWQKVNELRQKAVTKQGGKDWNDKYASYVEGLPATILACGFGQAIATLLQAAKGREDDPHYLLYAHLQDWLCRQDFQAPYRGAADLMQTIVSNDRNTYLRAQAESLAWLNWLKKLAVAYLMDKERAGRGGDR